MEPILVDYSINAGHCGKSVWAKPIFEVISKDTVKYTGPKSGQGNETSLPNAIFTHTTTTGGAFGSPVTYSAFSV